MQQVLHPVNESGRIAALKKYDLLDTPADGSFDRITQLAATIFKVPIALISLVDTNRIWFKSHHGLPINQIDREPGLCASAILSSDSYVIENALEDPRSLTNPLVAGSFGLRFYAASPLLTEDNFNLGTLCIIDKSPRKFSLDEQVLLKQLAAIVMDEMEMRLALRNTVSQIRQLSADLSNHLETTIQRVQTLPENPQNSQLLSYLDDSRLFLGNTENQLSHL